MMKTAEELNEIYRRYIADLEQQNAELLEALTFCLVELEGMENPELWMRDCMDVITEAIRKAKGE